MQRKVRIWTKIFFIVLVAIIPTLIITLYSAVSYQQTYLKEKTTGLVNLCEGFTSEQRLIARNAEEMFIAISQTRAIKEKDQKYLATYLENLMTVYPDYLVLLVADSSGQVIASGVGITGINISDRDYFQYAMKSGKFTVGSYVVSRSTGNPAITFSLPVRTDSGETVVLVGSYSLARYYAELSLDRLPDDACLEIFDYYGQRLFSSSADPEDRVGKQVSGDLYSWVLRSPSATNERVVIAGVEYLAAHGTFTRNGLSLHITLRTPYRLVLENSFYLATRIVIVMLFGCVLSFALSLWLARRLFVARIEKLTDYTQALARGDMGVRSEINSARDEITTLMESFNAMASALEDRNLSNLRIIEEKEQLLQELQKRISDNLQILSSMVNLQIEHASDSVVRYALLTTHSRIMALSLVYETIYRYSEVEKVQMHRYCNGLCGFLLSLYTDVGSEITCRVSGMDIALPIDVALPLALILNELVSNSLLHAFRTKASGSIEIGFGTGEPGMLRMSISDDGTGFRGDVHENGTLGYEMIEALVDQVHGTLTIRSDANGTAIVIQFPQV